MELKANVNFDRFEAALQVVDAHTVGEFCRMVIGGFPEPEGNTMIEKKDWMEKNYDHVRTALMLEPRGHHSELFSASQSIKKPILVLFSWIQADT